MSLADFLKPYLSTKYITGLVLLWFVCLVFTYDFKLRKKNLLSKKKYIRQLFLLTKIFFLKTSLGVLLVNTVYMSAFII